jgi:hypothetical protein
MSESFEQLQRRAHCGHWSFDELLEWYYEQGEENQRLRELLKEITEEIFPHPDLYTEILSEEQAERLRKELSDD